MQDDSLIFANETRWSDNRFSEPDIANTSEIFGSPEAQNEPTQVDLAEPKPVDLENEDATDIPTLLTPHFPNPRSREHSSFTEITEDFNDTIADRIEVSEHIHMPLSDGMGQLSHKTVEFKANPSNSEDLACLEDSDTQIINKRNKKTLPRLHYSQNDLNPTLASLADLPVDTLDSLDAKKNTNSVSLNNRNDLKETQVIKSKVKPGVHLTQHLEAPTQVDSTNSPAFSSAEPNDTQLIKRPPKGLMAEKIHFLNQSEPKSPSQHLSFLQPPAHILKPSQEGKLLFPQLNDTQIVNTGNQVQSLHKTISFEDLSGETQKDVINYTKQSNLPAFEKDAFFSSPCKFENSSLHVLEHSSMDPIIESAGNEKVEDADFNNNSIVEAEYLDDNPRIEATTQVLNTQEEIYDQSSLNLVDLGSKPFDSNSQNNLKRQVSHFSVASEDEIDNSEIEDVSFVYEDSIFNRKKRKLNDRMPKVLKFGKSTIRPEIMNSSLQLPSTEEIISSEPTGDVAAEAVESQVRLEHVSSQTELVRAEELSAIVSSEAALKEDWSSTSSELEDISRDASLSTLPFDESFTADGFSQEVRIPSRRRNNAVPDDLTQSQKVLREESLAVLTPECIVYGQAVWAFTLFRNFPAIVLNCGEDSSVVLDHNGKEFSIRNSDLHILDIRIGDFVLVTLKFTPYVVIGLYNFSEDSQFRCVRGFDTAIIAKKGKHSIAQGNELHVPLREICMEADQWASHQQRFQFMAEDLDLLMGAYSNVNKVIVAQMKENASFKVSVSAKAPFEVGLTRPSTMKSGLFSGMFFFMTSIEGDRKDHLHKLVTGNGGVLIDDEIDSFLERTTAHDGTGSLKLNFLKDFKFGALLSDGFSRSAKYLQALALGWPILADVYVEKVLEDSRMLDLWPSFLLPAGISLYFNGTKSHDVFQFRKNYLKNLNMGSQLANNARLLSSMTILILCHNQDKKVLNMCGFIFHAFGARSILNFDSCSLIEKYIRAHGSESTFIYDNNDLEFQKSHEKKFKRKSSKKRHIVGLIGWEWVVQCVISNLIWEPSLAVQV